MSRIFANIALSLDGYMAPEGMTMEHWEEPEYKDWGAKWGKLMNWMMIQKYFRTKLHFGEGGETGQVNEMVRHTMERTGANILGKRMFDAGEISWPEEAPFRTPVFVLTHERRDPWERPGGTTFYFVNDGAESALDQARDAAGGKDIRISGGANVLQQYLRMGVLEELEIALVPVIFGGGERLFENVGDEMGQFRVDQVVDTPEATHLRYLRV